MSTVMEQSGPGSQSETFIEQGGPIAFLVDRLMTIHYGGKFGYYEILADCGPMTSIDLANYAGTSERAAREWLETQVALGVLLRDEKPAPAWERRYRLPESRAIFLLNLEDPFISHGASADVAA